MLKELESGLEEILRSPRDAGLLHMIVRRPDTDIREVLESGVLNPEEGLVGDTWRFRSSSRTVDHSPHPDTQLTLMNSRVIALLAGSRDHWAMAGDQLFVDLDLSEDNLPPGSRLVVGTALIEITDQPHNGCKKFAARYGKEALQFISRPAYKRLRMRGVYAKVTTAGEIRVGDLLRIRQRTAGAGRA